MNRKKMTSMETSKDVVLSTAKATKTKKTIANVKAIKSERKSIVKKRNWAFVLYPESAPTDWIDRLQQTGLQCVISPLHDKDVEADGIMPKKAHYHIIACYGGPTSFQVVEGLTKSLNCPIPIALEQIRGYYRYLTHADNPDKAQYNPSGIKSINGFAIENFVEITKSELNVIIKRLQACIRENKMTEYAVLMDYLLDGDFSDEYDIASSHTNFFVAYLRSRRHSIEAEYQKCKKKFGTKD